VEQGREAGKQLEGRGLDLALAVGREGQAREINGRETLHRAQQLINTGTEAEAGVDTQNILGGAICFDGSFENNSFEQVKGSAGNMRLA
jgi:hypothetical protein